MTLYIYKNHFSPVLIACGIRPEVAERTVRFSFGRSNTKEEVSRNIGAPSQLLLLGRPHCKRAQVHGIFGEIRVFAAQRSWKRRHSWLLISKRSQNKTALTVIIKIIIKIRYTLTAFQKLKKCLEISLLYHILVYHHKHASILYT